MVNVRRVDKSCLLKVCGLHVYDLARYQFSRNCAKANGKKEGMRKKEERTLMPCVESEGVFFHVGVFSNLYSPASHQ